MDIYTLNKAFTHGIVARDVGEKAKLEISLKETNETSKWLEMLWKSDYIDEERYKALDRKCSTIRFLLVKSITTAKNNLSQR